MDGKVTLNDKCLSVKFTLSADSKECAPLSPIPPLNKKPSEVFDKTKKEPKTQIQFQSSESFILLQCFA